MKIVMICGSPRVKKSTSMYLLNALKERMENGNEIRLFHALTKEEAEPILEALPGSDVIVVAFPLYVDSLPSNLLEVLEAVEKARPSGLENTVVYPIVNNGFYDAAQNGTAINLFWNWCGKCGLKKGYAVAVGAGEIAQMAPLGQGPSTNLGKAIGRLAEDIREKRAGEDVFTEPNFPRFLYIMGAHIQWRRMAKGNGVKVSDIRRGEEWEILQEKKLAAFR